MHRRLNISTANNTMEQVRFPVGVVIVDNGDSYDESGKASLDKSSQSQYCIANAVITVQRFFDKARPVCSIVKELIEDQAQKWYTESGNMAVASQQGEGR